MLDLIENDHFNPKIGPNRNFDFPPFKGGGSSGSCARAIQGDFLG